MLDDIRKFLHERPHYPSLCKTAAVEVSNLGYEIAIGYVNLDNLYGRGISHRLRHFWNYDPKKDEYVDIIASLLNPHLSVDLPDIYRWQGEDNIYEVVRIATPQEIPYIDKFRLSP